MQVIHPDSEIDLGLDVNVYWKHMLMSNCCGSAQPKATHPKKQSCPQHGQDCGEVSQKTVVQHIKHPWKLDDQERRFFFCDDPDCAVVYFTDDGLTFDQHDVRTRVGAKDKTDQATLCYCFGVTKDDVKNEPSIKDFVTSQTKQHLCACETRNPSGLCCLKNFPK
ncbi:hypothetical protein V5T82_09580 [Magnetovibrio sp. PR-2]|uniref:putative iron-sulfur cluster-binding metallochaperone n=1 Tax=Magnetovibrio sp. PR-2 TaxID=3120356 RepID=UPI002FCE31C1